MWFIKNITNSVFMHAGHKWIIFIITRLIYRLVRLRYQCQFVKSPVNNLGGKKGTPILNLAGSGLIVEGARGDPARNAQYTILCRNIKLTVTSQENLFLRSCNLCFSINGLAENTSCL